MKRLQLILSMGFTTLGLSSAFGWTYIRYGLAKLSGSYYENIGEYLPVWLIVLIVLSFLIQLWMIFYKDEQRIAPFADLRRGGYFYEWRRRKKRGIIFYYERRQCHADYSHHAAEA